MFHFGRWWDESAGFQQHSWFKLLICQFPVLVVQWSRDNHCKDPDLSMLWTVAILGIAFHWGPATTYQYKQRTQLNIRVVGGFSETKGAYNYWLDAVRDFWEETGLDTDEIDLRQIICWFDQRRIEEF